jgi:hypothetical protein
MADPVTYPESFRCAQITPYRISVDMGVLRTAMDGGSYRQRRVYRIMPHLFQLEFVMTVVELGAWQEWVNVYAYDFFTMPKLESMYAGKIGEISSPHSIRFTSNLEIDNPLYGWVRVKVGAELDPLQAANSGPLVPSDQWIIAGRPAAPSNANRIIAGSPGAVSTERISAGSPGQPAAIIPVGPDQDALIWASQVSANGGTVSDNRLKLVSDFIKSEKVATTWALTDDYWLLAAEGAIQALTSLKQRRLATAVAAPTFTSDRGYTFNGTTQYLNTGFLPATHAVAMVTDSLRLGVYSRTNVATTGFHMGVRSSSNRRLTIRLLSASSSQLEAGGTSASFGPNADSRGFFAGGRSGALVTDYTFYKNGVAVPRTVDATAVATLPVDPIFIGAFNNISTPSSFWPGSIGFAVTGAALTPAQEAAQYTNIQTWATAIGAQV